MSNKNELELFLEKYPGYSQREAELMLRVEREGCRIIAAAPASRLFKLFLEGYTCQEIAKTSKTWTEDEVLYARKYYNWDLQRFEYSNALNDRVKDKLIKSKLESIEFLTNILNMSHLEHKEKMLKYMATGNEEDKPETWIKGPGAYKQIVEILQKVTGEDKVQTQKHKIEGTIDQNTNIKLDKESTDLLKKILEPESAAKMLKHLAENKKE